MNTEILRRTAGRWCLTVSDGCFHGKREDLSGPAVADLLERQDFLLRVDERFRMRSRRSPQRSPTGAEAADLIVTTGGTGLAPRDVTPEATGWSASGWSRGWPNGCAPKELGRLRSPPSAAPSAGR